MKKRDVVNLIKYHMDHNDTGFVQQAQQIAADFQSAGDEALSQYVNALLAGSNAISPQSRGFTNAMPDFVHVEPTAQSPLPLPESIMNDIRGIINAIGNNMGVNRFLFEGKPGTGKTQSAKQIARVLSRELYMVDTSSLIDSHLGQTAKNIEKLFQQLNELAHPDKVLVLFDEIDTLAMDQTNAHDVREMGRATSAMLKGLDSLNDTVTLIATTNLFDGFDPALIRRFDAVVNFDRYTRDDLLEVATTLMQFYQGKSSWIMPAKRLFGKIITLMPEIPYPGDLKNIIRTSIAFSSPEDGNDYLRRLYHAALGREPDDTARLKSEGFTLKEIETLTGVSKSTVSRQLSAQE